MTDQEWRDVRYLYNYNKEELTDLANKVRIIEQKAKRFMSYLIITRVGIFAQNAKTYQDMLDIEYTGLAPQQLKLF